MEFLPAVGMAALLFTLIAIGDVVSARTRARVPAILVAIILYLTLVWTGLLDGDVVSTSVVNQFGVWSSRWPSSTWARSSRSTCWSPSGGRSSSRCAG